MRKIAVSILFFVCAIPVFGQIEGNPPNWCRGGFFPRESDDYQIARINGAAKDKAYFLDDRDGCPGKGCELKSYVVSEDEVIISRTLNDYACAWYPAKKGAGTVGWLPIKRLDLIPGVLDPAQSVWLGNWKYAGNSIAITKNTGTALTVKGNAFWQGLGDNIHIGELDHKATPSGNILKLGDGDAGEYDCKVTLRLLGKYMVVADNLNCGGANVTFSGVYLKSKK
jgi:hypothetical protein